MITKKNKLLCCFYSLYCFFLLDFYCSAGAFSIKIPQEQLIDAVSACLLRVVSDSFKSVKTVCFDTCRDVCATCKDTGQLVMTPQNGLIVCGLCAVSYFAYYVCNRYQNRVKIKKYDKALLLPKSMIHEGQMKSIDEIDEEQLVNFFSSFSHQYEGLPRMQALSYLNEARLKIEKELNKIGVWKYGDSEAIGRYGIPLDSDAHALSRSLLLLLNCYLVALEKIRLYPADKMYVK